MAAVVCAAGIVGMNVDAAGGVIFRVENQKGKAGDVVSVPIRLDSGEEVGGFDLTVYYDSEKMEFQELQKGNLIAEEESVFDYNHKKEEASIKIIYVVADTVKADGVIANLMFKLKEDCGNMLPIGMEAGKVIDNSDNSNAIVGEVTGVDEEFQMKIDENGEKSSEMTPIGENEAEGEVANKSEEEQKKQNEGIKKRNQSEDTGKVEIADETQKECLGMSICMIVGGVVVIIMIGVVLGVVAAKRKKNGGLKRK